MSSLFPGWLGGEGGPRPSAPPVGGGGGVGGEDGGAGGGWGCGNCTFLNENAEGLVCEVCGQPRYATEESMLHELARRVSSEDEKVGAGPALASSPARAPTPPSPVGAEADAFGDGGGWGVGGGGGGGGEAGGGGAGGGRLGREASEASRADSLGNFSVEHSTEGDARAHWGAEALRAEVARLSSLDEAHLAEIARLERELAEEREARARAVFTMWENVGVAGRGVPGERASELRVLSGLSGAAREFWEAGRRRRGRVRAMALEVGVKWADKARERLRKRNEELLARRYTLRLLRRRQEGGERLSLVEVNYLRLGLEPKSEHFDCGICFGAELGLEDVWVGECGHGFCTECTAGHIVGRLDEGKAGEIGCPEDGCELMLSAGDVERVLLAAGRERDVERFTRFTLNSYLDAHGAVTCPKCEMRLISERGSPMVRCPNDACRFTYCASCRVEWHTDATCDQYQRWKRENAAAGDLFEKWREQHAKSCPKCKAAIEKNGGCNHMTCRSCKHEFCWLCMNKYTSGHFSASGPCKGKQFT